MYPLFIGEASGNITEAALSPTGKEQVTMKRIRKKFRDMKYRHKLTNPAGDIQSGAYDDACSVQS